MHLMALEAAAAKRKAARSPASAELTARANRRLKNGSPGLLNLLFPSAEKTGRGKGTTI